MNGNAQSSVTKDESCVNMDFLSNTTAIRQLNAPVFVLDFCGNKYIINLEVKGKRANSLLSLDSGRVLYQFHDRIKLVGYSNGFIYYVPRGKYNTQGSLECLNLRYMTSEPLDCAYAVDPYRASIYAVSGQISIPLCKNDDGYHYAVVFENQIVNYAEQACALQTESSRYYMTLPDPITYMSNLYTTEQVVVIDKHDQEQLIDLGTQHSTAPIGVYRAHNKCFVYCDQGSQIFFMIDSDNKPELVFSCECIRSETALAIHGTNVIISVKRYEKIGRTGYGYVRYVNDEFEGTYLVDLSDMSSRKITDTIFCGLFCPDESCVYGCNEKGDVFLLRFNGTSERVFTQAQ